MPESTRDLRADARTTFAASWVRIYCRDSDSQATPMKVPERPPGRVRRLRRQDPGEPVHRLADHVPQLVVASV
jgi:hypothetical protein